MSKKDMVAIKGKEFYNDFKSLCSSTAEFVKMTEKAGMSHAYLENWKYRWKDDGVIRLEKANYTQLCEVSGLAYDDYFIENATYFKDKKAAPKSDAIKRTKHLKNGVVLTTTYMKVNTKSEPIDKSEPVGKTDFVFNLSSFRSHLEIYRKLLSLHVDDIETACGIENYREIESGNAVLSISSYFAISKVLLEKYNTLEPSPLKSAFNELATSYHDIFIGVIYFGDDTKKKKGGR